MGGRLQVSRLGKSQSLTASRPLRRLRGLSISGSCSSRRRRRLHNEYHVKLRAHRTRASVTIELTAALARSAQGSAEPRHRSRARQLQRVAMRRPDLRNVKTDIYYRMCPRRTSHWSGSAARSRRPRFRRRLGSKRASCFGNFRRVGSWACPIPDQCPVSVGSAMNSGFKMRGKPGASSIE